MRIRLDPERRTELIGHLEVELTAYLEHLYTPEGQEIAARNFYRPRDPQVADKYKSVFADVELFTIDDVFGGWQRAQTTHFGDGGVFDRIYQPRAK